LLRAAVTAVVVSLVYSYCLLVLSLYYYY